MKYIIDYWPAICGLLHIIESFHDFHVSKSSANFNSLSARKSNRTWHKIDVIQWLAIYALICCTFGFSRAATSIQIISCYLVAFLVRWIILDSLMGYKLKGSVSYLSNYGIDGLVKRVTGGRLTLAYFLKLSLVISFIVLHQLLIKGKLGV